MADFKVENQTITLTIPTQASMPVISISNWIFVLHRYVPSGFSWNLLWNDHKNGFGLISSDDFFMGLERLYRLTTSGSYRLRLEWQQDPTDNWFSIEYWLFYLDNEAAWYTMHVDGYIPGDDGRVLCVRNSFLCCCTCLSMASECVEMKEKEKRQNVLILLAYFGLYTKRFNLW